MYRPVHGISSQARAAVLAAGLFAGSLATLAPVATMADEPVMPKSLDDAIRMERADALPLSDFYDAPALASSRPGALLRQQHG